MFTLLHTGTYKNHGKKSRKIWRVHAATLPVVAVPTRGVRRAIAHIIATDSALHVRLRETNAENPTATDAPIHVVRQVTARGTATLSVLRALAERKRGKQPRFQTKKSFGY